MSSAMLGHVLSFFSPKPAVARIAESQLAATYSKCRWSTLESSFVGYMVFYLVRNNLSTAAKDMAGSIAVIFGIIAHDTGVRVNSRGSGAIHNVKGFGILAGEQLVSGFFPLHYLSDG
jgi:hypothetical protein